MKLKVFKNKQGVSCVTLPSGQISFLTDRASERCAEDREYEFKIVGHTRAADAANIPLHFYVDLVRSNETLINIPIFVLTRGVHSSWFRDAKGVRRTVYLGRHTHYIPKQDSAHSNTLNDSSNFIPMWVAGSQNHNYYAVGLERVQDVAVAYEETCHG